MMNDSSSKGLFRNLAPHLICCGGMGLFILGTTSGFGTLLANGGYVSIGLAILLPVAGLLLWRQIRRTRRNAHRTL